MGRVLNNVMHNLRLRASKVTTNDQRRTNNQRPYMFTHCLCKPLVALAAGDGPAFPDDTTHNPQGSTQ
jgi:hypothetical protein